MQQLVARFVPAADEVSRLQRGKDAESRLFQKFAEQGHFAGRTKPTGTRQGIYAVAPSGHFLASVNTRSARRMAAMLETALAAWDELDPAARRLAVETKRVMRHVNRWRSRYPDDGLVLRVTSRDLGEPRGAKGWRAHAWNLDWAWFTRDEVRAMLPAEPVAGARHPVPEVLVRRIVRLHLVDNVRGQVSPFRAGDVETAQLTVEVTGVTGDEVALRLIGETRAVRRGKWPMRHGDEDRAAPAKQERGFETRLRGEARFDLAAARFTAFELVAVGTRWGGTQYNGRGDDLEPSAVGVVFELADSPRRVAPAAIWRYGWSR